MTATHSRSIRSGRAAVWAAVGLGAMAIALGVYLYFQPTIAVVAATRPAPFDPLPGSASGGTIDQPLGPGVRPWTMQYDDRGQLAYRFKGDDYQPQPDRRVLVKNPQAEFFTSGGQVIRLVGKTGLVTMKERGPSGRANGGGENNSNSSPMIGIPTAGQLKEVQIQLFDGDAATPSLIASVDNVLFDNETLRIFTQNFTAADGTVVPADQVPVTVRGRDVDFDGQGLTVRVSQKDRSIQSLEIAHGHQITIKNPGTFTKTPPPPLPPAPTPPTPPTPPTAPTATTPVPAQPAAPETTSARPVPSAKPDRKSATYRAVLRPGVVITQGDQVLARATALELEFPADRMTDTASPSTAAPATPSTQPPIATAPAPAPPAPPAPTGPASTAAPASTAPTAPAEKPIVIVWNGPLKVVAVPRDEPLAKPVLTLVENVELFQQGGTARADRMVYQAAGGITTLIGKPSAPVTLTDASGSVVTTPELVYNVDAKTAHLVGASLLRGKVDSTPNAESLFASWSRDCLLTFVDGKAGPVIKAAHLTGAVQIDHPQLKLAAQDLQVDFAPPPPTLPLAAAAPTPPTPPTPPALISPTGSLQLTNVAASGNVHVQLPPTAGQPAQNLSAGNLLLTTAPDGHGGRYPDKLVARNNVNSSDGTRSLKSDALEVTLLPAPPAPATPTHKPAATSQPFAAVQVHSALATGHVDASDGNSRVTGTDLTLTVGPTGKNDVKVTGAPAVLATADSRLESASFTLNEATGIATVPGPGTLASKTIGRTTSAPPPPAPAPAPPPAPAVANTTSSPPTTVHWDGNALADLNKNTVNITGPVLVNSRSDDGTLNEAHSDNLTLTLVDRPKATQPAATVGGGGGGGGGVGGVGGGVGDKQLDHLSLVGNFRAQSVLRDAAGTRLLRQVDVLGDRLNYAGTGAVEIPGPGKLLFADLRDAQPAVAPAAVGQNPSVQNPAADNPSAQLAQSARGTTAMQWAAGIAYDPAVRTATVRGDVFIAYKPLGEDRVAYTLSGDQVSATLAPTTAANAPAPTDLTTPGALQRVEALGRLRFTARGTSVLAHQMIFDPEQQIVIALAEPNGVVEVYDDANRGTTRFKSARFNLKTGQVEDMRGATGQFSGGTVNPAPPAPPTRR